jgi:anti-sigma28 factor (negative regulator of flagellin synthesis)
MTDGRLTADEVLRAARVAALAAAVRSGTYEVDPHAVAAAICERLRGRVD